MKQKLLNNLIKLSRKTNNKIEKLVINKFITKINTLKENQINIFLNNIDNVIDNILNNIYISYEEAENYLGKNKVGEIMYYFENNNINDDFNYIIQKEAIKKLLNYCYNTIKSILIK